MDVLVLAAIVLATVIIAFFNYYLNYAPGTTPDDFAIGPQGSPIRCDCCINYLILGAITVGAIAVSSRYFDTLPELLLVVAMVFFSITLAGYVGRRRRHHEWREGYEMLQIAMGPGHMWHHDSYEHFDPEAYDDEDDMDDTDGF